MRTLAAVVVYKRTETIKRWLTAWRNADKYNNTKLLVIHNYDGHAPPKDQVKNIEQFEPDYWQRPNDGQDIGAFRDLIRSKQYGETTWDALFWACDDNLPVSRNFLRPFLAPFELYPYTGLVGNYWVRGSFFYKYPGKVYDHFRTTCFSISSYAARRLRFPSRLKTKIDCFNFEWRHPELNMTAQVDDMGLNMFPVCGWEREWTDTNDYVWDVGHLNNTSRDPRCRKDYWDRYYKQFEPTGG